MMGTAAGPAVPPQWGKWTVRVAVRWACEAWRCGRVELSWRRWCARRRGPPRWWCCAPVGGLAGHAAPAGEGGPGGVEVEWPDQAARVVGSLTPKRRGADVAPEPGGAVPEASDFAREMLPRSAPRHR